jgi:hypothetical protein
VVKTGNAVTKFKAGDIAASRLHGRLLPQVRQLPRR